MPAQGRRMCDMGRRGRWYEQQRRIFLEVAMCWLKLAEKPPITPTGRNSN
jgi:hypothetical protein